MIWQEIQVLRAVGMAQAAVAAQAGVSKASIHPQVLVIDEVRYLSYGPDAANVLFQVVNER